MPNLLKNFTLDSVIAGTSPHILQAYFHKKELFQDIGNFNSLKHDLKASAYKKRISDQLMSGGSQVWEVIQDFHKIYTLANVHAMPHFLHYVMKQFPALYEQINQLDSKKEHDILFYCLDKQPAGVNDFYHRYVLNANPESHWNRRRKGIKKRHDDISAEEIKKLEDEIRAEIQKATGGLHCQIEHKLFDGKDHLYVIAEDRTRSVPEWKDGEPVRTIIRPVFEVAFVYDREEGELDVYCDAAVGGKSFRDTMQLAFSKTVLGAEIPVLARDDEAYDLPFVMEQLRAHKKVDFCTNSSDHIHHIFIRNMTLAGKFHQTGRITLDTRQPQPSNQYEDDIYIELDHYLKLREDSGNTVNVDNMMITRIECMVSYHDTIEKKDRKKSFSISGRAGCSLGFDGIDKEIRTCLKEASIQISGTVDACVD